MNFKEKKGKLDLLKQYLGLLLLYDAALRKGFDQDPEIVKQTLEAKKGLMVDKYLASEIPAPQISDSEVKLFFEANKEIFKDKKLEEVKDQIKFELFQQKRREAYNSLVAKLTQAEKVEIFEDKL